MEDSISLIQNLLNIDFKEIPDKSYYFDSDIDSKGNIYVIASKLLENTEVEIFPAVAIDIFKDGKMNICFYSNVYDPKYAPKISKIISDLYKFFISDDNNQRALSSFNLRDLYSRLPSKKNITWNNGKISISINQGIKLSLSYIPSNPNFVIDTYYKPYISITKNGLLYSREKKICETEASLLIDDFTKDRTILITKVAGDETEKYIFTYPFNYFERILVLKQMELGISFTYNNNTFFLHLLSKSKEFTLAKGDEIIFLFEDDTTITSISLTGSSSSGSGIYRNVAVLNYHEIRKFATTRVLKWKLTSKRKSIYEVGGFIYNGKDPQYKAENEGQFLLNILAIRMIQAVIVHEGNYFNESLPELLP
jgi:hypothetical protein